MQAGSTPPVNGRGKWPTGVVELFAAKVINGFLMPDEFDWAAREFARYCLNQPPQPDGLQYVTALSYGRHFRLDDMRDVLPLVTHWCRLNAVTLEIHYFDKVYFCKFTDSRSLSQTIETTGSGDLCHELLAGACKMAQSLIRNRPHASMLSSDFAETRAAGS